MTDQSIPADKVQEIINEMKKSMNEPAEGSFSAGYDNATSNWKRHLEALLPKPRTLADELRDEARGIPEHSLPRYRIAAFADRVETLEQERDAAQAEITHLKAREIPDGWRIAEHPEHGTVITDGREEWEGGIRVYYLSLAGDSFSKWATRAELSFRDEAPAPEPEGDYITGGLADSKPERIDPASCGRHNWYLIEVYGEARHGIRIDTKDGLQWHCIGADGFCCFASDGTVRVIRPLTSEEMDAR